MTSPSDRSIDIESLAREALSGVAVSAFARGIDLTLHIDHRLPARAAGDGAALAAMLRRGLVRTIEAGRTERIVLAFWREEEDEAAALGEGERPGDTGPRTLLEVGRALRAEAPHAMPLADLWALPLGGATAAPRTRRHDAEAESVLMALPCAPERDAPRTGEKWRETFHGRYVLHVRDVLCDVARLRASLAALGQETDVTTDPETALALARARVAAGRTVDLVLMDAPRLGAAAAELARAFRADPDLARTLLVLAGDRRSAGLSAEEMALFDAAPSVSMPWRRLIEVFDELLGTRAGAGAPPPAAAAEGIPRLAGRRILVAEDVATNAFLLRAVLEPTGAAFEAVSGGDAAVARQREAPADLVVMDLQMPGTGGLVAARRIRALGGAAGAVPIVALTAHTGNADRQRALAAGMDAFLAKPLVVAELYDLLRRMLAEGAQPR